MLVKEEKQVVRAAKTLIKVTNIRKLIRNNLCIRVTATCHS